VFSKIFKDYSSVLSTAAAIVLVAYTPRYVRIRCCPNPDLVSNIENKDYEEEMHLAVEHFRTAASAALSEGSFRKVFDIYQHLGQDEYAARDLNTRDGMSIWLDRDPVHMRDAAYLEIGMALLSSDVDDDDVFQPPRKRQGLESVVPVVQANAATVAKQPPATPSWLTRALQEPKSGGRGGGWGRGRGGGFRGNRGRSVGCGGGQAGGY